MFALNEEGISHQLQISGMVVRLTASQPLILVMPKAAHYNVHFQISLNLSWYSRYESCQAEHYIVKATAAAAGV